MEEVVGLNSTCWSKGRGGVKKAMSVKGIMLKCKGRGNSSDGLKHGGEGNGIGSHAAIGGVAELGGSCACCMCTLLGGEARGIGVCFGSFSPLACFLQNLPLSLSCFGEGLGVGGVRVPGPGVWALGGMGRKC